MPALPLEGDRTSATLFKTPLLTTAFLRAVFMTAALLETRMAALEWPLVAGFLDLAGEALAVERLLVGLGMGSYLP